MNATDMSLIDFNRLGRLQELLLVNRIIRSAVVDGRLREVDVEGYDLFRTLNDAERDALENLLHAQGWMLHEADDTMPGIPRNGRAWFLIRRPGVSESSMLTMEPAWRRVAIRSGEGRAVTTYWFTFIWLTTMSFMYERINRPISAVSEYIRAVVTRDELEERIKERIEEIRLTGIDDQQTRLPIASALAMKENDKSTTEAEIRRRVGNFLSAMADARMIEPVTGEGIYRQTLLCAYQISELFSAGLAHLVPAEAMISEMDKMLAKEGGSGFGDEDKEQDYDEGTVGNGDEESLSGDN